MTYMSILTDIQDFVEALPNVAKIGLCIGLILLALLAKKFVLVKPWQDFVRSSSAGWDDLLLPPLSLRLNIFIVLGGTQLSMFWLLDSADNYNQYQPYFGASYILLATSISSVSTKHLMPLFLEQMKKKRKDVEVGGANSILIFLTRFSLYFVGIYLAFNELGIDILGILASLSVVSLIIGIASKQTISNLINSFLLAVDRPFEVGDRVEIEGEIGTVISIGILSTKLLDRDENLIIIPNNTIVSTEVINHARGGGDGVASRKSLVVDVTVDYDEDIEHVRHTLLQIGRESPHCITNPEPRVLVIALDDYSKVIRLYSWIEDYSEEWVARDWILKNIDEKFKSEGISLSQPKSVDIGIESKSKKDQKKISRQEQARQKMVAEDNKLQKQREESRQKLKQISEKIDDEQLSKKQISDLEFEAQAIRGELSTFEREG